MILIGVNMNKSTVFSLKWMENLNFIERLNIRWNTLLINESIQYEYDLISVQWICIYVWLKRKLYIVLIDLNYK